MIEVLAPLLILVLIFGAIVFFAVQRGLQMRELCIHGVETTAVIVEKRTAKPRNAARQHKLMYRYTDSVGTRHEHTSVVTNAIFGQYDSGGPIQVVYSSRKPCISLALPHFGPFVSRLRHPNSWEAEGRLAASSHRRRNHFLCAHGVTLQGAQTGPCCAP